MELILLIVLLVILSINFYVKLSTKKQILKDNDLKKLTDVDCILVLGAGIIEDRPTLMLRDRIFEAISLYKNKVSPKIIMSGDHSKKDYDEVNIMKKFAIKNGIPSEDVFMDHAGFSSYESIYRAKEVFNAKKIVIVSQKYHLYRALYIANRLGVEAYGSGSDPRKYEKAFYNETREILARNKDFIKCFFKPKPTYLGEAISLKGDGNSTNG